MRVWFVGRGYPLSASVPLATMMGAHPVPAATLQSTLNIAGGAPAAHVVELSRRGSSVSASAQAAMALAAIGMADGTLDPNIYDTANRSQLYARWTDALLPALTGTGFAKMKSDGIAVFAFSRSKRAR